MNPKRFGRRFALMSLIGLLALFFGGATVQRLTERWIENRLASEGVNFQKLTVNLERGELILTQAELRRSILHVQIPQLRVTAGLSTLWNQDLRAVTVELDRVGVSASLNREPARAQHKPLGVDKNLNMLVERLNGVHLTWTQVQLGLRSMRGNCNVRMHEGQLGVMSSMIERPVFTEVSCDALGTRIDASLDVDLSLFPRVINARRTQSVTSSTQGTELDFEAATLTIVPTARLTVHAVRATHPRGALSLDVVELSPEAGRVSILAQGGTIDYRRGLAPSSDTAAGTSTQRLDLMRSLPFELHWFRPMLSLDGQLLAQIKHMRVQPNVVSVDLIRGDSSLTLALEGMSKGWRSANLSVTGHIELADIDMFWPSSAMIDGAIGVDGNYDLKSGEGTLAVLSERIRVLHPSLSLMPFHLPQTQTRLFGSYKIGEQGASVTGRFKMGLISSRLAGALGEEGDRFDFRWSSESVPCESLTSVLPLEWVEELGVKFRGTAHPRITLSGSRSELTNLRFRLRGIVEPCRVESVKIPWAETGIELVTRALRQPVGRDADVSVLNQPFIKTIDAAYTDGTRVQVGPASGQYTTLSSLPPYVAAVMFLSEEVDFYKNLAVDLGLIQRALGLDLTHGRYVYGGSTITQQLVKNLILDRRKTLRRKFHELLVADRLYQRVSKDRILELYLNVIEFGPQIFGIEAASAFYFQKLPSQLTVNESIFLAMLKPDPSRGADYVRRGRTPTHDYWFTRSDQLLKRLVEYGAVQNSVANQLPSLELFWSNGVSVATAPEK